MQPSATTTAKPSIGVEIGLYATVQLGCRDHDARDRNMSKRVELDGLSPQEAEAARLRATGLSQVESYRQAFSTGRAKQKTLYERSSKLFAKPEMKTRIRELLSASKLADLESLGEASQKLLEDIDAARERGNDNAVMGFTRIKMQMHGALKDAVSLSVEQRQDDATLIDQLAGDDPAKAAALRQVLGASEGFDETRSIFGTLSLAMS